MSLANIRITLSMSRYTRREMLDALASTPFPRTAEYESLVRETASMCVPDACPVEVRGGFTRVLRHCGARGELIHTEVIPL